jgi:hypothetical protein
LDLFVSFKDSLGQWSAPVNLGKGLSTEYHERFPSVSRDGRFLFFVRAYGEVFGASNAEFYWVRASVLDRLRESRE